MTSNAFRLRMRRLHGHGPGLLVVPLDHAVTSGPVAPDRRRDDLVAEITANGADAIVLHKGTVRHLRPESLNRASLIVHLSAGTVRAPDPDARCLVAGVAEALRLGADAVSVHVNIGSAGEQGQLRDLASVAGSCERWNMPLLAMVYPRGPAIADPTDPDLVAHAVSVAVELGADLVKTVYPGRSALAAITSTCPVPVIVAGGPRRDSTGDVMAFVADAMRAGAAGVAIGRNIFETSAPGATTRKIAELVHGEAEHGNGKGQKP